MAAPDTSRSTSPPGSEFSSPFAAALKGLAWFHRWVGVALCLMFATWFATGAMMVFVAFPSLTDADRTAHSEVIDLAKIRVDPAQAAILLGKPGDLRLISRGGVPVYVARQGEWDVSLSAQSGKRLAPATSSEAGAIASAFGRARVARVSGPLDYDQWVVHQQFDPLRPFYRVRLADPQATDLYVSSRTGEVEQRTRGLERAANWVGSVIHWIYIVPIRKSFALWDWTVWSVSLVGLTTVVAGVGLGITRSNNKLRSSRPAISPFRGLLRWHHILGLAAGAFVLCWITSGWLSMDHGRLFSDGSATEAQLSAYAGPVGAGGALTAGDLRRLGPATSITFQRVGGRAVAGAAGPEGAHVLVAGPSSPGLYGRVPDSLIASAVHAAWPTRRLQPLAPISVDEPYAKAESLTADARLAAFAGDPPLRVYVDSVSGKILVVMNRSREAYAWVYYMLHTYNFPGLSSRPVLRITILLIPLTLGFAFSVTGVLVGVRRLRLAAV